jgi:hypothetical protein
VIGTPRDDQPTFAYTEIERLIEIVAAFAEDIATANAELRGSVFDVSGHVVGLEQQKT